MCIAFAGDMVPHDLEYKETTMMIIIMIALATQPAFCIARRSYNHLNFFHPTPTYDYGGGCNLK